MQFIMQPLQQRFSLFSGPIQLQQVPRNQLKYSPEALIHDLQRLSDANNNNFIHPNEKLVVFVSLTHQNKSRIVSDFVKYIYCRNEFFFNYVLCLCAYLFILIYISHTFCFLLQLHILDHSLLQNNDGMVCSCPRLIHTKELFIVIVVRFIFSDMFV